MGNLLTVFLLAGSVAAHAQITVTAAQYPATAAAAARELAGGLLAWPSPAASGQAIRVALASVAATQPLHLTLRDVAGRVVASTVAANGQPATLPALPAGLYLAEAAAGAVHASCRVVVE